MGEVEVEVEVEGEGEGGECGVREVGEWMESEAGIEELEEWQRPNFRTSPTLMAREREVRSKASSPAYTHHHPRITIPWPTVTTAYGSTSSK